MKSVRLAAGALAAMTLALAPVPPARAQTSVPIVRDAEIEALLRDYARPILNAAGLGGKGVEIVIVNNPAFNAFVDGRRIFINTGTLLTSETPNEVIGVIAHEAGHIAGGHQERLRDQIARAKTMAVVGSLLGIGVAAAGAMTDTTGAARAGTGIVAGAPSVAMRGLLSYRRSEEITADRMAVGYLNQTGQSAAGMLKTFERFSQSLALAGVRANPYEQSHPMPRDRMALLETLARQSYYYDRKDPPALQLRHDMMRGKIAAYTGGQTAVMRAFSDNPRSIGALYGDAIATFLASSYDSALTKIDNLIAQQPNNAYLHEMRGEILLRAGRPGEAAKALERAVNLDPSASGLIRAELGFAYLSSGDPSKLDRAIQELRAGISADPDNLVAYRQLSQAYGRAGDIGNAELAMAEGLFQAGQLRDAQVFAVRARQKLPNGSPGWLRANDIVNYRAK